MKPRIGVVGTAELVEHVCGFRHTVPHAELIPYAYADGTDGAAMVREHGNLIDAWLCTDPIAHHLTKSETTSLAVPLEYGGSALLVGIIGLLARGRSVTHLSIDSMESGAVQEVLSAAGIPTADIRVFNPGPTGTAEEIADFHLGFMERGYTALTCISAVHETVSEKMPCVLLTPPGQVIRATLTELVLTTVNQVNEDSQVAVGFLRHTGGQLGSPDLGRLESTFGAFITRQDERTLLIVTTRRGIQRATADFTASPFGSRLGTWAQRVHCGFGLGLSAPEAAKLAARALQRSEGHEPPATVISLRHDSNILLKEKIPYAPGVVEVPSVGVVAAHSGLSTANVLRLQKVARSAPGGSHTTRDIADALGIEMRTARRLMQRLEQAGYAERVGQQASGTAGRPLTLYQIAL